MIIMDYSAILLVAAAAVLVVWLVVKWMDGHPSKRVGSIDPKWLKKQIELDSKVIPDELDTFKPEYIAYEHGEYLHWLIKAVYGDEGCRNVALAGPYGSGKSSILGRFAEIYKDRTICVQLSKFFYQEKINVKVVQSSKEDKKRDLIDDLECEVVRQLLYQGKSWRLPQSRYNQIHPIPYVTRFWQSILIAGVLFAILVLVLYLADNTEGKLGAWFNYFKDMPYAASALLLFILLLAVWFLVPYVKGRINIAQVGVGTANVCFEGLEGLYFDRHLDEIIYFFERHKFDTVIFEDLDRFDDPRIFEALRELNVILNGAPGINKVRRKGDFNGIHFIYALRDSIFDEPDSGMWRIGENLEARGSQRVKFFDAIIPVPPFVSELNALEHARKLFAPDLEEYPQIENALRIVASHVVDMRSFIAVRNEYLVMKAKQFDGANNLGLKPEGILAMAAYKTVYPNDYEKIRLGCSYLDQLLRFYESVVDKAVGEQRSLAERFHKVGGPVSNSGELATRCGERFQKYLDPYIQKGCSITLEAVLPTGKRKISNIVSVDLWQRLCKDGSRLQIGISDNGGGLIDTITLPRDVIVPMIGIDLNSESFSPRALRGRSAAQYKSISMRIQGLRDGRFMNGNIQLRKIDDSDLPNGWCMVDSKGIIDAQSEEEQNSQCFINVLRRNAPGRLAADLVIGGVIDTDYALYASIYPSDGRRAAIGFYTHCYKVDQPNIDFKLDDADCAELVKRTGGAFFSEPKSYNVDLLKYLLRHEEILADEMISGAVLRMDSVGGKLLRAYTNEVSNTLADGTWRLFLQKLLSHARSFEFVVNSKELSDGDRVQSISYMLENASGEVAYVFDRHPEWFRANLLSLPIMTTSVSDESSKVICQIMRECGVEVTDLSRLQGRLRSDVESMGLFEVNEGNLFIATGRQTGLLPSLDELKDCAEFVYRRVLWDKESLKSYVSLLSDESVILNAGYEEIASDIVRTFSGDDRGLERFIERCPLELIEEVEWFISGMQGLSTAQIKNAIALFARTKRIVPTMNNIVELYKRYGNDVSDTLGILASELARKPTGMRGLEVYNEDDLSVMPGLAEMVIENGRVSRAGCLYLLEKMKDMNPDGFPIEYRPTYVVVRGRAFISELQQKKIIENTREMVHSIKSIS